MDVSYELSLSRWDSISRYGSELFPSPENPNLVPDLTSRGPLSVEKIRRTASELEVPFELLHCYFRTLHTAYIKNTTHATRGKIGEHLRKYLEEGDSLVAIARGAGFSPYLIAKMVLEGIKDGGVVLELFGGSKEGGRGGGRNAAEKRKIQKRGGEIMKDVKKFLHLFDDSTIFSQSVLASRKADVCGGGGSILARDLLEAIDADVYLGPLHDRARRLLGVDYELHLEERLKAVLNVPFRNEENLRDLGFSKTPDVLLECPVGVWVERERKWRMISWIDSKALFGDPETHNNQVIIQASSYVHRYGPGLIIYYFGHSPVETLEGVGGVGDDVLVCGWDCPEICLLSSGEVL